MKRGFASQQQVDQQQAVVGQYQGAVANDEAQMDYARTQLGFTSIASPIDGRTGIRQVDAGNYVRASDATTIVVVTQLRPISVVFTVSADAVARSKLGLGTAHIPVVALAQDDVTELDHGTVDLVDNVVDQSTGTIKLKASFPNTALTLWPGNFVNGRLVVDTRHDGVTVPAAAVRHGPRCDFAWVVRPDQNRGHPLRDPGADLRRAHPGRSWACGRGRRGGGRPVPAGRGQQGRGHQAPRTSGRGRLNPAP